MYPIDVLHMTPISEYVSPRLVTDTPTATIEKKRPNVTT